MFAADSNSSKFQLLNYFRATVVFNAALVVFESLHVVHRQEVLLLRIINAAERTDYSLVAVKVFATYIG